jgi:hypothetical protein
MNKKSFYFLILDFKLSQVTHTDTEKKIIK